ncbi:MAG: flavodoxin-dependent (E)-4-hydroxy-3-methylbut-2-enyl-diphosphate synthase [Clostridia bacterium]|nr:flavodoxin-dependent (E)-4-hydroxy-3-methylbut-2-enyl-diphosphate synthase [Clostridia bacterium]
MTERFHTKKIRIANKMIGGGSPVAIQSMLNAPADDVKKNIAQAIALEKAGCDIIRVAIPDKNAVGLVESIKSAVSIPLVADIHFDYRLALDCVAAGVDKIRINPGNIGDDQRVAQVVRACHTHNVPIRIGVNSGSVEKHILEKHGAPTAEALVESGLYHIHLLEKFDFENIVLSIKSSDTKTMYAAYLLAAERCTYPLHLGVTEAGTERAGIIKSAVGIGGLLLRGIGDTIRVSLTADPVKEVYAAKDILRSCGLYNKGIRFVSCPTCGRTKINLIDLAQKAEEMLQDCDKNITVAIMGCVVNGPGEAKEADIGIAGGDECGLLFKKGEIIRKLPEDQLLPALLEEIKKL